MLTKELVTTMISCIIIYIIKSKRSMQSLTKACINFKYLFLEKGLQYLCGFLIRLINRVPISFEKHTAFNPSQICFRFASLLFPVLQNLP